MLLKWPILRPPSRFLNRIHCKPLTFCLGVLLMAMFSVASADTHFTNVSTRASIDNHDVSTGFIIQGTGKVTVFIKGRSLEAGVDPILTLKKSPSGKVVATNNNWKQRPNANKIPNNLKHNLKPTDAGLLLDLVPGGYTATLSAVAKKKRVIIEINAVASTGTAKLINGSGKAAILGGDNDIIQGFMVRGPGIHTLFIRGVGIRKGVDPILRLRKFGSNEVVASNDNWQQGPYAASILKYPHNHLEKTTDAGLWLDLKPGLYTVTLSSNGLKGLAQIHMLAVSSNSSVAQQNPDGSITFTNPEYTMRVTPKKKTNQPASPMVVMPLAAPSSYAGNNSTANVLVTPKKVKSGVRDSKDSFTVITGKEISGTGKTLSMTVTPKTDGSYSIAHSQYPTVSTILNPNGSYTITDVEAGTTAAVATDGSYTIEDNEFPGMQATVNKDGSYVVKDDEFPGIMTTVDGNGYIIKDDEFPGVTVNYNADGSYTVTDEEFPNLIGTFYTDENNVITDYLITDTEGVCYVLDPNTRSVWNKVKDFVKKVVKVVNKVAGVVKKVAGFVAKVAGFVAVAAGIVKEVAVFLVPFMPFACQFLCTVAAFAGSVESFSLSVAAFAHKVEKFAATVEKTSGKIAKSSLLKRKPRSVNRLRDGKDQDFLYHPVNPMNPDNCKNIAQSPAPALCQLYAVNDTRLNNSQFFTVNLDDLKVNELGPLYKGYDIEALTIHPQTNTIYAASGNDVGEGQPKGYLYIVDGETGELFPIGSSGFNEIGDLAFAPDGTLWAWAKNDGMITIDPTTGLGTLQISSDILVEGLTLSKDKDHTTFFGSVNTELWVYDMDADSLEVACTNLIGETEGLEIMPDGMLLIGTHKDKTFNIHAFDPNMCQIVVEADIPTYQFGDVEGIALPVGACAK